jgi:hypothetical protein
VVVVVLATGDVVAPIGAPRSYPGNGLDMVAGRVVLIAVEVVSEW